MAVLSELGGIFTLKKEQITAQKPFVGGKDEIFPRWLGWEFSSANGAKTKKNDLLALQYVGQACPIILLSCNTKYMERTS